MLKESLEQFVPPVYGRTKRSSATYQTVATYCESKLTALISEYKLVKNDQQLLREMRNDMDYYLRRYHKYCIEQRDGMQAHYREIGSDADCDFEHLIPASRVRDLLHKEVISVKQALNAPTVRLSRAKHKELNEAGWGDKTPDMWLPFRRYSQLFKDTKFETFDGTPVDPETWTLERHFEYFKHLTI